MISSQLKSQGIFLFARLVPSAAGVVTTAVLTRMLPPSAFGLYALALSAMFFVTMSVFEWLALSLLRMAPGATRPAVFFGTIARCYWALMALCIPLWCILALTTSVGRYPLLAMACLAATFASAWFELRQGLLQAEYHARAYFTLSIARALLTAVLVCLAGWLTQNAAVMLLALAASMLASCLIVPEPRLSLLKLHFESQQCWELLRFGVPLSISVALATALVSIDKWMLQLFSGSASVGLFAAAALVCQAPVLALASGIGPASYSAAVQALESESREAARVTLARNLVVLSAIIVPGAAGIVVLSGQLAHLVVGPAYWNAVAPLAPWLAGAALMASIRAFYLDQAFQLANRTVPLVWTTLAIVVANVLLDIWLIPLAGLSGAAIASFASLAAGSILTALAGRLVFPLPLPAVELGKVAASTVLMVAVLLVLPRNDGPLALLFDILLGALSYGCALAALDTLGAHRHVMEGLLRT